MIFGVLIPMQVESSNLSVARDGSRRCKVFFSHNVRIDSLHFLEPSPTLRQYNYTDIIYLFKKKYLHHEVKLVARESKSK
jgi:hypothetical protein